jgi:hypothetical protein
LLGFKHSEETIAKMSGENNPMFGRIGENHHLFGKSHSAETKAPLIVISGGEKNPRGPFCVIILVRVTYNRK